MTPLAIPQVLVAGDDNVESGLVRPVAKVHHDRGGTVESRVKRLGFDNVLRVYFSPADNKKDIYTTLFGTGQKSLQNNRLPKLC